MQKLAVVKLHVLLELAVDWEGLLFILQIWD